MTDSLAKEAAISLSKIQNYYWGNEDTNRFEIYLERIARRYQFIKDVPEIGEACLVYSLHR